VQQQHTTRLAVEAQESTPHAPCVHGQAASCLTVTLTFLPALLLRQRV
jgi:hypothetical protein